MTAQGKERQSTRLICSYPSELHKNISKFEGCWSGDDQSTEVDSDVLHCDESFDNFPRGTTDCSRSLDSKCALGGDLILCRLSSSLYQNLNGIRSIIRDNSNTFPILPQDSCIILPTLLPSTSTCRGRLSTQAAVNHFLNELGIEEIESLQPGGAGAGQCQFASIASALTWNYDVCLSSATGYRPDLALRKLALHVIETNTEMYQHYLTMAGGRTRSNSAQGGSSIDCRAYLRTMSSPTCDGDAVTLQALSDALQITVRLVKAVDADAYDEKSLRQRLYSEGYSVLIPTTVNEEDDVASVITISDSDDGVSTASDSSLTGATSKVCRGRGRAKRLFISSEIRPRSLKHADPRMIELQKLCKGRLVWLSHIGDEAHYRFLRPTEARFCSVATRGHLLVGRRETAIALACQKKRIANFEPLLITIECNESAEDDNNVNEVSCSSSKRKPDTERNESFTRNNSRPKRRTRPVAVTNITREHWNVRSYT